MSDQSESELLHKGACDICGSSDARAHYSDGHSYCFACDPDDAWQAGEDFKGERPAPLPKELIPGDHAPLGKRRLTLKTVQKFDYRIGQQYGESVQLAPYHDKSGRTVAQKVRPRDKDKMHWVGKKAGALPLFGQSKWKQGGRMVVVTEGEIDAMSVAQAMGLTWPAVSVPDGAPNAAKAVAKAADWLESFERVVFMFDMDEHGREAAAECAALITPGKAFIAELPLKDASEMLQESRSKELVDAAWQARPWRPDGIRTVADLKVEAMSPQTYGLPWPWRGLTEATYGIRSGEIQMIGAGVGTGKTTAFKQLMASAMVPELREDHAGLTLPELANEPRKVGAILLEEKPGRKTLKTIAGMVAGKRFHVPGVEYTDEELSDAIDRLDGLFFAYEHFGAKDWEGIKPLIRYMVLGLGIRDVFLDHLTALVAGAEDERRELDAVMADMASLVEELDFRLYVISHLTTPTGTPHEEGGRVMEKHFTGSRAIARWSHNMHGLERDKQEPDSPTTWRILKERETGDATGVTIGLEYDRDTGLYREVDLPSDEENKHGFKNEEQDF